MLEKKGFSMIEIAVAMVILTIGFFPIYNLFRQGTTTTSNNIHETIATNYASDLINFCKDLKYFQVKEFITTEDETTVFEGESNIQNFFKDRLKLNPPELDPLDKNIYQRTLSLTEVEKRDLPEAVLDWFKEHQKVPTFIVKVEVKFPKTSNKNIKDDSVTLFSIIMD